MTQAVTSECAETGASEAQRPGEIPKESHQGWFPFRFDLAEQAQFKELTPRKVVILLDICNRVGQILDLYEHKMRDKPYFAEKDETWAKRLRVDVQTFRDVRYELGRDMTGRTRNAGVGWFEYKPGHGDRDGKLYRTEYHGARFGQRKKGEPPCALIYRLTWGLLIEALKRKTNPLDHADVAAYAWLAYLWERYGGGKRYAGGTDKKSITIPKNEIEEMTGIAVGRFMRSLAILAKVRAQGRCLFQFKVARPGRKWIVEVTDWRPLKSTAVNEPPQIEGNGEYRKERANNGGHWVRNESHRFKS